MEFVDPLVSKSDICYKGRSKRLNFCDVHNVYIQNLDNNAKDWREVDLNIKHFRPHGFLIFEYLYSLHWVLVLHKIDDIEFNFTSRFRVIVVSIKTKNSFLQFQCAVSASLIYT